MSRETRGACMTVLMNAVKSQDPETVRNVIRRGADVDELDAGGNPPLVMAAYQGRSEIVRMLLDAGADVSAVDPEMKATALHAAAYAGNTDAAKLLIAAKIDIDRQGPRNGYTALHDAIWQNNIETARALVEAGANLELRSHSGKTPLDFAREKRRTEIVALIEAAIAGGV